MSHKIKLLQRVVTADAVYEFGSTFDWSKEFIAWIRENKINHVVFEGDKK